MDKYYINREHGIYLTLSPNTFISSIKKGEYYISDWRDKYCYDKCRDTIIGLSGKALFSWLKKNSYEEMDNIEVAKYLLLK